MIEENKRKYESIIDKFQLDVYENFFLSEEKNKKLRIIYNKSVIALIEYIKNNKKYPNEKEWNKIAIKEKHLSAESIGYICGMGFNPLCRKLIKIINKMAECQ